MTWGSWTNQQQLETETCEQRQKRNQQNTEERVSDTAAQTENRVQTTFSEAFTRSLILLILTFYGPDAMKFICWSSLMKDKFSFRKLLQNPMKSKRSHSRAQRGDWSGYFKCSANITCSKARQVSCWKPRTEPDLKPWILPEDGGGSGAAAGRRRKDNDQ